MSILSIFFLSHTDGVILTTTDTLTVTNPTTITDVKVVAAFATSAVHVTALPARKRTSEHEGTNRKQLVARDVSRLAVRPVIALPTRMHQ